MKYVIFVAFSVLLTIATSVNAAIVRVGNIQSDDTTNFMTDTTSGRMYSRLDATLGRTFSQITTEDLITGGSWDGWSIATSVESEDLISALRSGAPPSEVGPCLGGVGVVDLSRSGPMVYLEGILPTITMIGYSRRQSLRLASILRQE
jgi:hypothetical protein